MLTLDLQTAIAKINPAIQVTDANREALRKFFVKFYPKIMARFPYTVMRLVFGRASSLRMSHGNISDMLKMFDENSASPAVIWDQGDDDKMRGIACLACIQSLCKLAQDLNDQAAGHVGTIEEFVKSFYAFDADEDDDGNTVLAKAVGVPDDASQAQADEEDEDEEAPPRYLYHGTLQRYRDSIDDNGLVGKATVRGFITLQTSYQRAFDVPKKRHGADASEIMVLAVDTQKMLEDGLVLEQKDYGFGPVWEIEDVDVKYILGCVTEDLKDDKNTSDC